MLQLKILLRLLEQPITSITELADRLGAHRPSVSRSLHTLKDEGLVVRDRRAWRLTREGEAEAAGVSDRLVETLEQTAETARRVVTGLRPIEIPKGLATAVESLGASLQRTFADVYRPLQFRGLSPTLEAFPSFSPIQEALKSTQLGSSLPAIGNAADSMRHIGGFAVAQEPFVLQMPGLGIADAITPLVDIQQWHAELISEVMTSALPSPVFEDFAKYNNLFLADAIDSTLALRQDIASIGERLAASVDLSWLPAQLTDVNVTFANLFRTHTAELHSPSPMAPSALLAERLTSSTATVASHTRALRYLVEAEAQPNAELLYQEESHESGDDYLDPLLRPLNPDWPDMRRGCWFVLNAGGPDRLRHAATSQRELFVQVLTYFVPDFQLPEDSRQGPQIKPRMKMLMRGSESDAEFADAVAKAVYHLYTLANKFVHDNQKHEASLRAMLRTGEGLLRFIIVTARGRTD